MKKFWIFLFVSVLLTGCATQETFETVTDEYVQPVASVMRQAALLLPEDAAVNVMQNEDAGTIYFCDGYTLTLQTMESGDLNRTVCATTGYDKDRLRILETMSSDFKRYDFVWTAAGEGEDQVGRGAVLDDGSYHYVLTCMTGASQAEALQEQWQSIFASFCLTLPGLDPYTGS